MPQLDSTSFPSQLFWLMVSFVILYVLLARFLLPRVQSVLTMRAQTVETDIAQAEHMKAEAVRANEQYEKLLAESRAKSQALLAASHAEIAERAAARQAELEKLTEKKLLESETAIRTAKQSVMGKLAPVAGDLASLIVEVLVHQKPSADEIGAAISGIAKERSL
jgi:F-type H+-transporting ATPase subunit b